MNFMLATVYMQIMHPLDFFKQLFSCELIFAMLNSSFLYASQSALISPYNTPSLGIYILVIPKLSQNSDLSIFFRFEKMSAASLTDPPPWSAQRWFTEILYRHLYIDSAQILKQICPQILVGRCKMTATELMHIRVKFRAGEQTPTIIEFLKAANFLVT